MNFNYTGVPEDNRMNIRFEKPKNYPHGFKNAEDAAKIFNKKSKSRERNKSKDRKIGSKSNWFSSIES